jgi:hypothetical protein
MFAFTSRYYAVPAAELEAAGGKKIAHLRRRFVPAPERFDLLFEHTISEGDRLDNVAAEHLGDPEQFWRLADANRAVRPEELTDALGRRLRVTLPEGIPGSQNA